MKARLFLSVTLVLGATFFVRADDPLDAKLDALKKKAQRRTYSTSAVLTEQGLIVPQAATDEEKALDEKIRAMEKEADARSSLMTRQRVPQPAVVRPMVRQKPTNWLTPALLDDASTESGSSTAGEDSWIMEELTRQKNIQLETVALEEERKLVDQRLRGEFRGEAATGFTARNDYNESLRNIISGGSAAPVVSQTSPGILSSRVGSSIQRPAGAASAGQQPESFFKRRSSAAQQPSEPGVPFGTRPARKSAMPTPPSWATPETEPLSPTRPLRRSSPIHQENPFEENLMPTLKKSIWD